MDERDLYLRIAQGTDYKREYPIETPYGTLTFYISPLSYAEKPQYLNRISPPVQKRMGLYEGTMEDVESSMPDGKAMSKFEDMAVEFLQHPEFSDEDTRKILRRVSDEDLLEIVSEVLGMGQNMDGVRQFAEYSGLAQALYTAVETIGLEADDPSELTDLQIVGLQHIFLKRQEMLTPEFE